MSRGLSSTVLVLEDSDEDFDTVVEAARRAQISITLLQARTGDECLSMLQRPTPAAPRPVLLLLDLNTPGMDGRDVLTAIRQDPRLRGLPVVVLSSSRNTKDLINSYALGANAYHEKPTRYADHVALVEAVLGYWLRRVVLLEAGELGT